MGDLAGLRDGDDGTGYTALTLNVDVLELTQKFQINDSSTSSFIINDGAIDGFKWDGSRNRLELDTERQVGETIRMTNSSGLTTNLCAIAWYEGATKMFDMYSVVTPTLRAFDIYNNALGASCLTIDEADNKTTIGADLAVSGTTASTTSTTGALTVAGGVGVAGEANLAGATHLCIDSLGTSVSPNLKIGGGTFGAQTLEAWETAGSGNRASTFFGFGGVQMLEFEYNPARFGAERLIGLASGALVQSFESTLTGGTYAVPTSLAVQNALNGATFWDLTGTELKPKNLNDTVTLETDTIVNADLVKFVYTGSDSQNITGMSFYHNATLTFDFYYARISGIGNFMELFNNITGKSSFRIYEVDDAFELTGTLVKTAEREKVSTVATSTTLTHTVTYVRQTASGITTTLWASPTSGDKLIIKNRSTALNTIGGNGNNIEGSATYTLNSGASVTLIYNGTDWDIL